LVLSRVSFGFQGAAETGELAAGVIPALKEWQLALSAVRRKQMPDVHFAGAQQTMHVNAHNSSSLAAPFQAGDAADDRACTSNPWVQLK
jgi:hypothetical protein